MRRPPVVVLFLLFAATAAPAQSPISDWSPVRQLSSGQPVRVLTDAAIVQAGTLSSVTDDSVTLNVGGQDQRIARDAIRDEGCNESAPAWFYPMAGAGAPTGALMPPRTVWREVYARVP